MNGSITKIILIGIIFMAGGCKDKKEQLIEHKASDANSRNALIAKIKAQRESANIVIKISTPEEFAAEANKPPKPLPVVSLEDFFEGNNDLGSIGCNLVDHPGIPKFYKLLKEIRARKNVQTVLVSIYEIEGDSREWPFSDTIFILTSASNEQVSNWLAPLQPDEISEGWGLSGPPSYAPPLKEGMKVFYAWWD